MRSLLLATVVLACGARSSLDDYGDAGSLDAMSDIAPIQHPDVPGIDMGPSWVCVYRPGMKSGCTGTFLDNNDASDVELPEHMWAFTNTWASRIAACAMTPDGVTCWGWLFPNNDEVHPPCVTLAGQLSRVCQPYVVGSNNFVWVSPMAGLDTQGQLYTTTTSTSAFQFDVAAQPAPLVAVDPADWGRGIDALGRVVTWLGPCGSGACGDGIDASHSASLNAPVVADLDFRAVGVASDAGLGCAWDALGHVACWGNANTLTGPSAPQLVNVPPAQTVVGGSGMMCSLGLDGSVTCFGCTSEYDYYPSDCGEDAPPPLTPQPIPLPHPAIALASGSCALLADQTVWCWGWALEQSPPTGTVPWHVVALDP